jgi:hypothetical protein
VTETAIAISVVVIVIPIRTAATTDDVLPAANSAAAVRVRCHPCPFGGLIGGIVINDDTIAADALATSPLPPLGTTDPTDTSTTKTLDGTMAATATAPVPAAMAATALAMEEEEGECDATAPTPDAAWTTLYSAWRKGSSSARKDHSVISDQVSGNLTIVKSILHDLSCHVISKLYM